MSYQTKPWSMFLIFMFSLTFYSTCAIADEKILSITTISGKEVCQSTHATLGESQVVPELCVIQGSFSHDKYMLKIDGKTFIKGIDDETSKGLSSKYKNNTLSLKCIPQNVFPKETAEQTLAEVQEAMPNSSEEETLEIAKLLGTGVGMGMEIGRLCEVKVDSQTLIKAQVLFK